MAISRIPVVVALASLVAGCATEMHGSPHRDGSRRVLSVTDSEVVSIDANGHFERLMLHGDGICLLSEWNAPELRSPVAWTVNPVTGDVISIVGSEIRRVRGGLSDVIASDARLRHAGAIAAATDGSIYVGLRSGDVHHWSAGTLGDAVAHVEFSVSGLTRALAADRYLAVSEDGHWAVIQGVESGAAKVILEAFEGYAPTRAAAISDDGVTVVFAHGTIGRLKVRGRGPHGLIGGEFKQTVPITSVAVDDAGRAVVASFDDGEMLLFDVEPIQGTLIRRKQWLMRAPATALRFVEQRAIAALVSGEWTVLSD